uniref:Uncharacterized protein n=1 Tax=Nelumbo nucifera TaxID=4432 RepID=A0A822Z453_NELNU|nr:TPA_asm: hypothetical protein HUJ06_013636 [Nelumbo nucifera]
MRELYEDLWIIAVVHVQNSSYAISFSHLYCPLIFPILPFIPLFPSLLRCL